MLKEYDIYNQSRITLHCVINLLSPLSHIGEVTGNVSNLKTLKLIDFEGNPRNCFVYSGNALRNGILRRRGISAALGALGLTVNPDVHHTLFAGGRIDGSTASDMDLDRKIRQFMPWLSVLGTAKPVKVFGSKDAQMMQGRLNVGSAYLVCYESAPYIYNQFPAILPADTLSSIRTIMQAKEDLFSDPFIEPDPGAIAAYAEAKQNCLPYLRKALKSWTEYLIIDQTIRRDSTHDSNLLRFLSNPKEEIKQPLLLSEEFEEKKATSKKKSDQSIANDRLIMAGSQLYSRWDLHTTAVETGWIVDTLLKFAESPYLGGKGNRGCGLCKMEFWFQKGCDRGHFLSVATDQIVLSEMASNSHSVYQDYLDAYREFLAEARGATELKGLLDGTT